MISPTSPADFGTHPVPTPAMPAPVWIDTETALRDACARWRGADVLAIDTEFVRERTFFPALGLIQIAVGDPMRPEIALIDGVRILDLAPLGALLRDPRVLKILHAPGEDFGVFQHAAGFVPTPVFDTQSGAALAGYGYGVGYGALVASVFGNEVPKGAQRTNWLRRPLSSNQLTYAARDVLYLPALHRHLHHRLDANRRVGWALEDSARLADDQRSYPAPEDAWRKVKGTGRLRAPGRGALEALAAWREIEARKRDLPRGFVLRDDALVALAAARPVSAAALQRTKLLSDAQLRRDSKGIVRAISQAPPAGTPLPKRPAFDPRPIVGTLKELVAETADTLGIPPETLASRKSLESLVLRVGEDRDRALPEALRGWRESVIGEPLVERARTLVQTR